MIADIGGHQKKFSEKDAHGTVQGLPQLCSSYRAPSIFTDTVFIGCN